MSLAGRHALVCGGSAGIGRAAALAIAALGAEVTVFARRREALEAHVPESRAAGYGRIVNVISTSVREPIPGLGVSNIVRGAMASWVKTLSRELPPGVTINNLLPGYTDTERLGELAKAVATRTGETADEVRAGWIAATPEDRFAWPEEMGSVIAFLASPAAAFIRGQSLAVDGGRLASI